jgi:hypothetical protein
MRRRYLLVAALIGAIAAIASVSLAANPHLRKGSGISCTISTTTQTNDTVTCTGTGGLAGLGNDDWKFVLTGTGGAKVFCKAPGTGGNEAPGQNPAKITVTPGTQSGSSADIKNGNLAFFGNNTNTLTATGSATAPSATEAGCPNPNWTTRISAIFWTSVTLTFEQPVGTTILTCTASDPNGLTGTFSLAC